MRNIIDLIIFIWIFFQVSIALSATLPTLPQQYIDTTYSAPTGATCTAANSSAFQTCLNNAALNSTIVLQAGTTYSGNFTLPNKTTGSGWIYIVSSNLASLPAAGTRVSPSNAANMPKIVTPNYDPAINAATNAHHYRFVGIEFSVVIGVMTYYVVKIGSGETSIGLMPNNFVFDRCYVHGNPNDIARRGISLDGVSIAVIDSYISDFKETGADAQAVWGYNTPGPIKIVNNYLEATGENILFGGSDSPITNLVPSDIEIKRNYFFKPLSWLGTQWQGMIKNLLELKNAQRVLVEGNIFENSPAAAQSGFAIVFTPRNQGGGNPWSTVSDVTFRLNKLINVGSGINILGRDANSQYARRILIENNLMQVTGLNGADRRTLQILSGPIDITFRHNTGLIMNGIGTMTFTESTPQADQFDFRDNIVSRGYGFIGTGTAEGLPTLNAWYTNWTLTNNAIITTTSATYPSGNYFPANVSAVGFVDYAGGNYRLTSSSPYYNAGTDGLDLGADIDAIESAIIGNGNEPVVILSPTNLRIIN